MIIDMVNPDEYDWADVKQYLDDTLELFRDGAAWGKGSYYNAENGCRCLVGGICRTGPSGLVGAPAREAYPAEALVEQAIMELYPSRDTAGSVVGFNDHHATEWADVRNVLMNASRRAQNRAV